MSEASDLDLVPFSNTDDTKLDGMESKKLMVKLIQKYPVIKCITDHGGLLTGQVVAETIRNPDYTLPPNYRLQFLIHEKDFDVSWKAALKYGNGCYGCVGGCFDINCQDYSVVITACDDKLQLNDKYSCDFDVNTLTWNGEEFSLWTRRYGFVVDEVIQHCMRNICYHRIVEESYYEKSSIGDNMETRCRKMTAAGWNIIYMKVSTVELLTPIGLTPIGLTPIGLTPVNPPSFITR